MLDSAAREEGIKLEHKEELSKANALRATLQAQVDKLRKDQTKGVTAQAATLNELKKKHAAVIKDLQAQVTAAQKQVQGQRAAAAAVSASADQVRQRCSKLELALETAHHNAAAACPAGLFAWPVSVPSDVQQA